jgi:hypothetical protein
MTRQKRHRRKIRTWYNSDLGILFRMGMDKDDPRYRLMKERMRVEIRDRVIVVVVLVVTTVACLACGYVLNS